MKDEDKNTRIKRAFYLLIVFALAVVQIVILNQHSSSGEELKETENKISKVRLENKKLSKKIASASSMVALFDKAKDRGLEKEARMVSLDQPLPIALSN